MRTISGSSGTFQKLLLDYHCLFMVILLSEFVYVESRNQYFYRQNGFLSLGPVKLFFHPKSLNEAIFESELVLYTGRVRQNLGRLTDSGVA